MKEIIHGANKIDTDHTYKAWNAVVSIFTNQAACLRLVPAILRDWV